MKKGFLFSLIFTSFLVASNTALASSEDVNGDLTYEEGAEVYVQTKEDSRILQEKLEEIESYNKNKLNSLSYIPDGEVFTLSVPIYQQINGYYCGPATVKQVAQFVKGKSSSQDYYAGQLGTTRSGTDMTKITSFLKNNVKSTYTYSNIGTHADWMNKVRYGMVNKMPAVLDINTNNVSAFPYNSSGHFVNTSGYDTKTFRVRISDPFGPGLGNRWYNSRDVYNANNNHFRKAIIW